MAMNLPHLRACQLTVWGDLMAFFGFAKNQHQSLQFKRILHQIPNGIRQRRRRVCLRTSST